jgi:hypothetical protein
MKTAISNLNLSHRLHSQRGASLLEGIAYLGIAAIVVLGAVSLLTTAFGSAKTNQSTEELISLRTGAKKLFAGQSYPAGDMLGSMITANAQPASLVVNKTAVPPTANNTFGGAVTVVGATTSFKITYNSVPQDVCVGMVSGANGWTQIDQGGANTITTFPATAAQAATVCGNATNSISFTAT